MIHPVEIENIEQLRLREGIDDLELRQAIRGLRVGDLVRLTLLTGATPSAGEMLLVRITRIRGETFRGKLTQSPSSANLSSLRAGAIVVFSRDHIHSLPAHRADADE
jgi:hypothetical protein